MKTILLIGLGRFGRHCARKLNELGHQVMAVDVREDRVDAVLPYVTDGLIGNSTRADFMKTLGVRNYDVCIVAIGDDFQSSLETTALRCSRISALSTLWQEPQEMFTRAFLQKTAPMR